jgi:hypothetical protein
MGTGMGSTEETIQEFLAGKVEVRGDFLENVT